MRRRQGAELGSNPARPRLLTRARRAAFLVLFLSLVASGVTSIVVALVVGRSVLDDDSDQRLDRAVGRADDAAEPADVSDLIGFGRVEVHDGALVGPAGVAADRSELAAAVLDAAATGETIDRGIELDGRASQLRAIPVSTGPDDAAVLVGVIPSHKGTAASLLARLLAIHAVVFLAMALLAVVISRRSTRIMESLFQQEDHLMRAVVHEIRNPLSRALVAVDEGLAGVSDPKAALDEAATLVEDVDELIGDLLETARVMTGATSLPRDVVALDDVAADATRTASTDDCTVLLELQPVTVVGSGRLLRRAVSNLVRNAARHAYRGGPGVIRVRVDGHGVSVFDDGPGVAPERLDELHYDTTLSVNQKGAGLGLNICGWVAEMHGGRLELANRPEGGFVATVRLPGVTVLEPDTAAEVTTVTAIASIATRRDEAAADH
ncbi:MAG TPA: HAMP domain-containing sensor histidine kinase [Iamia sp.]|nr:HAMP domain-containing sensor histidine kinase [Iamia sp.]